MQEQERERGWANAGLMDEVHVDLRQGYGKLLEGIEAGLVHSGWFPGWIAGAPVFLLLSLAECAVVIFVYRLSLVWQGGLLQDREQKILESVTTRAA